MSKTNLQATVQNLGDVTIIHLAGRLVRGEGCSKLRDAVLSQSDGDAIVLNLGQVDAIDAYGIGMLLRLQESARSRGTVFKLMNTVHQVHRVLLVTGLDRAFEFCSVPELLCLMHRASERPTQAAVA